MTFCPIRFWVGARLADRCGAGGVCGPVGGKIGDEERLVLFADLRVGRMVTQLQTRTWSLFVRWC